MANEFDLEDPEVMNAIKEAASTQTPDQLQNTFEDAGVDLNRFTGAGDQGPANPEPPPVPMEQFRPAETNDYSQPFYSRLERGPDGTLQGVGQGTIYDRQGIAARNLASGQLSSASDLYQEAAGGPVRPQPQLPPSLEQQLAQTQLNQFEQAQLTQAQHGLSVVSQKLMANSMNASEAHRAIAAYNSVINPLLHRQTQANELMKHIAHRDGLKAQAMGSAMNIEDFKKHVDNTIEKKLSDGSLMVYSPLPNGRWDVKHIPAPKEAKAAAEITPQKAASTAKAEATGLYPGGSASTATNHSDWKKAFADSYHEQMKVAGKLEMPKVDDFLNNPTGFVGAMQDYANQELKKKGMTPQQGAIQGAVEGAAPQAGPQEQKQPEPPEPSFTINKPATPRQQQFVNDYQALAIRAASLGDEKNPKRREVEQEMVKMANIVEKYGGAKQVTDLEDKKRLEESVRKILQLLPTNVVRPESNPPDPRQMLYPPGHPGRAGAPLGR